MCTDLKKRLIQTLVFPLFDYCDVVYQDLSSEQAGRLQRLQNRCVRFVLGIKNYRERITPSLNELSWLRLSGRRKLHMAVSTYKILSSYTPSYLYTRFSYLSSFHTYQTRTSDLLVPLSHTQTYHSSFILSASRLWNDLPAELEEERTLKSFRTKVFLFLLNAQKSNL